MAYDLRHEAWIPWRRRSGAIEWGSPAMLVSGIGGDDPVVGIAAPRPDFDGALQEFLIGLLSAALQPFDEPAWKALWNTPPDVDTLQTALARLPDAFDLEGEGARIFQDRSEDDFAAADPSRIEQLLIDTPGEQGIRLNKDLFVKRDRMERLGRPAAAMALLTMQTYAPAGGSGYRTSLRGGGPLVTLVDPRVGAGGQSLSSEEPLWRKLWSNVETLEQLRDRAADGALGSIDTAFPWLSPTRTSNPKAGGGPTPPAGAHPLEAYFGLPRRIRLEFGDAGACGLTGREDTVTVTGFRARNYGVQYSDWQHPLTPHYRQKAAAPWLPMHGQPGGVGWRDWLALTLGGGDSELRRPAAVVSAFARRGTGARRRVVRLHVFGYDMDNAKARGWVDATMPAFALEQGPRLALLRSTAASLVEGTSQAAYAVLNSVKAAWFRRPDDARGDLEHVRAELWAATEAAFYGTLATLASSTLEDDPAEEEALGLRTAFAARLRTHGLAVFDRHCPVSGLSAEAIRRRVVARYELFQALGGFSKQGEKIFQALAIPLPGGGRAARAAKSPTRKKVTA